MLKIHFSDSVLFNQILIQIIPCFVWDIVWDTNYTITITNSCILHFLVQASVEMNASSLTQILQLWSDFLLWGSKRKESLVGGCAVRYGCLPYVLGENVCMSRVSGSNRSITHKNALILWMRFSEDKRGRLSGTGRVWSRKRMTKERKECKNLRRRGKENS